MCERKKNANKALHSYVEPATKGQECINAIETAVAHAVMRCNHGKQRVKFTLREQQLEPTSLGDSWAVKKDYHCASTAKRKCTSSMAFQAASKKKQKQKPTSDYSPGAFWVIVIIWVIVSVVASSSFSQVFSSLQLIQIKLFVCFEFWNQHCVTNTHSFFLMLFFSLNARGSVSARKKW